MINPSLPSNSGSRKTPSQLLIEADRLKKEAKKLTERGERMYRAAIALEDRAIRLEEEPATVFEMVYDDVCPACDGKGYWNDEDLGDQRCDCFNGLTYHGAIAHGLIKPPSEGGPVDVNAELQRFLMGEVA